MNPDELARLIEGHSAALELFARQWCDDPADAVQAAFVRLIEQAVPPDRPVAWLFQVVRNTALMQRRSAQRRREHEADASRQSLNWFESSVSDDPDGTTATQALQSIADECREVIIARIWGGLTFAEIGEIAGVSSSTAHRRYLEGLDQLRKKMGVSCLNE